MDKIMRRKIFQSEQAALVFFGLALECAVFFAWFRWKTLGYTVLCHFAGSVFLGMALLRRRREIPKMDFWQPLFTYGYLLVVFFPGLGAWVLLVLCFLMVRAQTFRKGLYEDYESYLSKKQQEFGEVHAARNTLRQIRDEISFEPLADIMTGADVRMKQRAIKKLSQRVSKESVTLLQEATRDPSPEIRLYAAAALLEMEAGLNARIRAASELTRQKGNPQAYAELGSLYWDYVETGLGEQILAQYYLGLAADAFEQSFDMDTNQPRVLAEYARVLLALRRFEKARRVMDRFVHLWPGDNELIFLRQEIYFNLGLYKEVENFFEKVPGAPYSGREKEIFEFWTAPGGNCRTLSGLK